MTKAIRPLGGGGAYPTARRVIAIGILDKPNKPECKIPPALSKRVHYDITSEPIAGQDCLVVGGDLRASNIIALEDDGGRPRRLP